MLAKPYRLKKNSDFNRVFKKGKSIANKYLVIYFLSNKSAENRFGFVVSKKMGKAVARNRIKRRLREICRLNARNLEPGYDIIIIPRASLKTASIEVIKASFLNLLKKAGILAGCN